MITLNGTKIKPTIFNDNTSQFWQIDEELFKKTNEVVWEFENEAEFMHLAQLGFILSSKRVISNLSIPYLPYGRQDKSVSNDYTFSKLTFLMLLRNIPGFRTISTLDCHSDKHNHLCNIIDIAPAKEIYDAIKGCTPTMICYPDKGAKDRYSKLGLLKDFPSCSFTKERDGKTGYITNLFLNEIIDVKDESILIVDDITDGGMTFKLTSEKLLTLGAKEVTLYTTHGIYSKGTQTLRDSGIIRIFNRKGEVNEETDK